MELLILGGTAFLGRALAQQALERGYRVTCLARGSAPAPDGVRMVRADRGSDDALAPVADEHWDAVIDVTRHPVYARRAVRDLRTGHFVFISSGNVYARFDRPEQAEDAETLPPLDADLMPDADHYGQAKVACEQAVREASSWTILRAGLIGGADDETARSGYYPWRFAHPTGPDVILPPDPTFPTALVDVQDLATFTLDCAVRRHQGVFNVTGPTTTLGELVEVARTVAGSRAVPRWVPGEMLNDCAVLSWMGPRSLPLWIDDPDWRWFATLDTSAARAHGLRTRELADTLAAALDYENRRVGLRNAGLSDDEERHIRSRLG